MEGKIMLMRAAERHMPDYIKKKKLKELFRLTADAFQAEIPELRRLSFSECLREYAIFTRRQAECCIGGKGRCTPEEAKSRLAVNSFLMGKHLKKYLHIMNRKESIEALGMIYRLIGIDFQCGSPSVTPEEFVIRRCFFSSYYSPEVCRLVSALDEGLAEGLTGDKLCFVQRITEGAGCCIGCLTGTGGYS